jgi:hypothetical protein
VDEEWKIRLVRTGGFAGIAVPVELGPGDLTQDELSEVEQLLDEIEQGPATAEAPGAADRFQYDLTLERGEESRHVTVGDGALDRQQRAVLKRLLARREAS